MPAVAEKNQKTKVDMKMKMELMYSVKSLNGKRSEKGQLPFESQLKDFSLEDYFTGMEVVNFCNMDETSPFKEKGKIVDINMIQNWVATGTIYATKPNYFWYISKEEVLRLFELHR